MLRSTKDLENYVISATDGEIGHVKDFYFDDDAWVVRYLVVEAGSPELPQCGHCPHAGRGPRSRACLCKNNFEELCANEACHSFFDSERPLTRIRYLSQFAQALASFGAGEILQGGECRRHDRRAPQGAPGMRPGSVWCATPNGRQTSTKRRDVQFSPTCQSGRSVCCRLTQREDSCYQSVYVPWFMLLFHLRQCGTGSRQE